MPVLPPELMSVDFTFNEGDRDFRDSYRLRSVGTPGTRVQVLTALGLALGSPHPEDAGSVCKSISLKVTKDDRKNLSPPAWWWEATATFSSKLDRKDPEKSSEKDPTQRNPRISIRQNKTTGPAKTDVNGDPVANSAGDPVRRERRRSLPIIVIDKAVQVFPGDWLLEAPDGFLYSRNLTSINPFGPYAVLFDSYELTSGKAMITDLSAEIAFDNAAPYVQVHCEIELDDDRFLDRFWDEGYRGYEDTATTSELVQLLDQKTGMFPSQPLPLDGSGYALDLADPAAVLHELSFQYYPERDWTLLLTALGLA